MSTLTATERQLYPAAGTWELDPSHTTVEFVARHLMVSKVRGRFETVTGTIEVGDDILDSMIDIDLDVASLTTGSPDRDGHLASTDFFEVADHPTIHFTSTGIASAGDLWQVTGDLTVRGVTKPVTLDLDFAGLAKDPWGTPRPASPSPESSTARTGASPGTSPSMAGASSSRRRSRSRSTPRSNRPEPFHDGVPHFDGRHRRPIWRGEVGGPHTGRDHVVHRRLDRSRLLFQPE